MQAIKEEVNIAAMAVKTTRSKCFLGRKIVRISDFFGDSLIDDIEDRHRGHFSVIPAAMT